MSTWPLIGQKKSLQRVQRLRILNRQLPKRRQRPNHIQVKKHEERQNQFDENPWLNILHCVKCVQIVLHNEKREAAEIRVSPLYEVGLPALEKPPVLEKGNHHEQGDLERGVRGLEQDLC